jgi:hypothetical protein
MSRGGVAPLDQMVCRDAVGRGTGVRFAHQQTSCCCFALFSQLHLVSFVARHQAAYLAGKLLNV